MIAFLTGRLVSRSTNAALLEVGGVGYRLLMSTNSLAALPDPGDEVTILTYLHVREDELTLYGFESDAERSAFEALIGVSGVGPKVALATLSALTADALARAVASEDVALVSTVPGVGKKTAQRIIVDLAGKLTVVSPGPSPSAHPATVEGEVREALLAMGFSVAEISAALAHSHGEDSGEVLRSALKRLGGGA